MFQRPARHPADWVGTQELCREQARISAGLQTPEGVQGLDPHLCPDVCHERFDPQDILSRAVYSQGGEPAGQRTVGETEWIKVQQGLSKIDALPLKRVRCNLAHGFVGIKQGKGSAHLGVQFLREWS